MPIYFNTILLSAGFELHDVRLLRHKVQRATKGRSPFELWRDNRSQFEYYQAGQSIQNASKLNAPFWASFVGTPADETLFVGMYAANNCRLTDVDRPKIYQEGVDPAGSCYIYDLPWMNG